MAGAKTELIGEDIILLDCAKEDCVVAKRVDFYAKDERRYYALHYVTGGGGTLRCEGGEYPLVPGDLFLIPPAKTVSYEIADSMEYYWVNVTGKQAIPLMRSAGFTDMQLVVHHRRDPELIDCFSHLVDAVYRREDAQLLGRGWFYLFMGRLAATEEKAESEEVKNDAAYFVREAVSYLKYNYYYPDVNLSTVARSLSVNKNYLCTIFKKKLGITPMQYLIDIRIDAACKRLAGMNEPISQVARIVGYKDPLYFSKEFKKRTNMTPSEYREAYAAGRTQEGTTCRNERK